MVEGLDQVAAALDSGVMQQGVVLLVACGKIAAQGKESVNGFGGGVVGGHVILIEAGCGYSQHRWLDVVGRECIVNDPKWKDGNYNSEDISSINGLALARMIGHITYISKNIMDKKFGLLGGGIKALDSFKGRFTQSSTNALLQYPAEAKGSYTAGAAKIQYTKCQLV